jgi:hypothetical protein
LERKGSSGWFRGADKLAASLEVAAIDLMANEHEAGRAALVKEITQFLDTADEAKVKILYRIMKGIL